MAQGSLPQPVGGSEPVAAGGFSRLGALGALFKQCSLPSVYIVSVFLDILVPNTQENLGKTALLPEKQSWVLLCKQIFHIQESQSHAGCRTGLSHVHGPPRSPTH